MNLRRLMSPQKSITTVLWANNGHTVNLSPDAWKIIQDYVARDSTTFVFYELASTNNLLLHTFGKLSVRPEVFNFESLQTNQFLQFACVYFK
jgi:hypothetical protein